MATTGSTLGMIQGRPLQVGLDSVLVWFRPRHCDESLSPMELVATRTSLRTRGKILKTSIDLFNRFGVQNVSLERVASRMGISRGNLTYHFKRKQDLIRATLAVLEEDMRAALAPPARANVPEYGAEYMLRILHALWASRFFFNGLSHLLTDNKPLRKQYFLFQEWAVDTIDRGIVEMIRHGDCTPMREPNSSRLLAKTIWSQWLIWLHMQHIESPSATKPEGEAFYDCALHTWVLLEPYFSEAYARDMLALCQELLLRGPGTRARGKKGRTTSAHNPD